MNGPLRLISRIKSSFRAMVYRSRTEAEMDAELRFHIESYTEDLVRSGVSRKEAERRAYIEFGGVEGRKEECREARGLRWVNEVRGDLRYAVRTLRKSPVFTIVAILSLALGIGANTAIFTLTEAVLLKMLPVERPEELRLLSWTSGPRLIMHNISGNSHISSTGQKGSTAFSYPLFKELRQGNQAFSELFAFRQLGKITATMDGQAELVAGELVSGNFYKGLRLQPVIGRTITGEDDQAKSTPVAVMSDSFWNRRFGRDVSVLSKQIHLNAQPFTIIGVTPPEFKAIEPGYSPDIFVPFSTQPRLDGQSKLENPDDWWISIAGRLKPDLKEAQEKIGLNLLFQQTVKAQYPAGKQDIPQLEVLSGDKGFDYLRNRYSPPLRVLTCVVGLVLLIACANLASLLLARAAARQREIGVRLALGAGRWRIVRQILTESLFIAMLGGALGLALPIGGGISFLTCCSPPGTLFPWTLHLITAF